MNDLRTFLHGLPAFERFNERQLDNLLAQLRLKDFEPGHRFVAQDSQGPALYIIVRNRRSPATNHRW
jgi:signal-transduction protein with cAMP-binding, CBS, and nucleotidyltransferase domain